MPDKPGFIHLFDVTWAAPADGFDGGGVHLHILQSHLKPQGINHTHHSGLHGGWSLPPPVGHYNCDKYHDSGSQNEHAEAN